MKTKSTFIMATGFIILLGLFCCNKQTAPASLDLANQTDTIASTGSKTTLRFNSNSAWRIDTTGFGWVKVDPISGDAGDATINISVSDTNKTGAGRTRLIYLSASNGLARRINVFQPAYIFPSYNTSPVAADASGMSSTATQLIAKLKLGVNIGNTLELNNIEPYPTAAYISFLKQTGFNAVRIPCGWFLHGGNNPAATIPQSWMDSVKQVIQWCVNNDMYVFINIHWDGGWLENNVSLAKSDSVNARQKAYWEQIATAFRGFDEHVLFASANEPNCTDDATAKVLVSYHQTFINAVRSTGGRNAYRTLIIQGPDEFIRPGRYFPSDPAPDRLVYEFHNYSPTSFAILDADPAEGGWGYIFYYWGAGNHSTIEPIRNSTNGEETEQLEYYKKIKENYIDKGIPCVMGEYSANRRSAASKYVPKELDKHNNSVDAWYTFLTKQCLAIGAKPFMWETGGSLDRTNNVVRDQRTISAVLAGGK
jgi:aryl-phospho-beta-D-glucosidase BglC (GH1 family)